jgi:hypothetical protein
LYIRDFLSDHSYNTVLLNALGKLKRSCVYFYPSAEEQANSSAALTKPLETDKTKNACANCLEVLHVETSALQRCQFRIIITT